MTAIAMSFVCHIIVIGKRTGALFPLTSHNASKDLSQIAGEVACDSAAIPMSGATCAPTPNSRQSDWQAHDTIPRRAH